jgi:hypothetical protein
MNALPSFISIAPKGQADTQVSQPVQISGLTFTLTDNSLSVVDNPRRPTIDD